MADSSIRAELIDDGPDAGRWRPAGWAKVGGILVELKATPSFATEQGALKAGYQWVHDKMRGKER